MLRLARAAQMDCELFYDLELAFRKIAWGDLALVETYLF
jgi:hypothetical protein